MSDEVKNHISNDFMINDKYHTQYDFMHIVYLSYLLRGFLYTDPKTPKVGTLLASRTKDRMKELTEGI